MATSDSDVRQVVAVFRTEDAARRAADAATIAGAADVRVDSTAGDVLALQSEMRDEMEHTIVGPGPVGPFTKEATKGLTFGTLLGLILGAVAGIPFAAIDFGLPLGQRMAIAVLVGAFAGATVGFVVGGGLGARGPAEPLASEEGTTVVAMVPPAQLDRVERAFTTANDVIRVDLAVRDQPIDNIVEDEDDDESVARDLARKTVQGEGDWSHVRTEDKDASSRRT